MPSSTLDYEVIESIGSGTFGTCKKIRRKKDGKVLVWKEIDYSVMSEDSKQMLVVEVNLLRQLRHEYIVRYFDRIINKAKSMLYIVMEFCDGGDLASYINAMKANQNQVTEMFVWKICIQIASALQECHSRSRNGSIVLHRDLKPANVFLDAKNNAKIGDFGLARILQPHMSHTKSCVGTPFYMSPEQLLGNEYNEKSDMWSLGIILYELCSLRLPFLADSQFELAKKVTSDQIERIPITYSDELFKVIRLLLEKDPSKRYSVELLLLHPALVARQESGVEIKESGFSEVYVSKFNALWVREASLNARESSVIKRESNIEQNYALLNRHMDELNEREKILNSKEKLVEERMTRATKLMKQYTELKLELIEKSSVSDSGISSPTDVDQQPSLLTHSTTSSPRFAVSVSCKKGSDTMRFPSTNSLTNTALVRSNPHSVTKSIGQYDNECRQHSLPILAASYNLKQLRAVIPTHSHVFT